MDSTVLTARPSCMIYVVRTRRLAGAHWAQVHVTAGHKAGARFWVRYRPTGVDRRINRQVARHLGPWTVWTWRNAHLLGQAGGVR